MLKRELARLEYPLYTNYDLGKTLSAEVIQAPVDFALEIGKKLELIEIEMRRADPSNTIAKIVYCLGQLKEDALIIQWISSYYRRRPGGSAKAKEALAKYLGKQLLGNKYYPIDCEVDETTFNEWYQQYVKDKKGIPRN